MPKNTPKIPENSQFRKTPKNGHFDRVHMGGTYLVLNRLILRGGPWDPPGGGGGRGGPPRGGRAPGGGGVPEGGSWPGAARGGVPGQGSARGGSGQGSARGSCRIQTSQSPALHSSDVFVFKVATLKSVAIAWITAQIPRSDPLLSIILLYRFHPLSGHLHPPPSHHPLPFPVPARPRVSILSRHHLQKIFFNFIFSLIFLLLAISPFPFTLTVYRPFPVLFAAFLPFFFIFLCRFSIDLCSYQKCVVPPVPSTHLQTSVTILITDIFRCLLLKQRFRSF